MMVAVGNGVSFGGGLRITEGAVLDDGLLDVVFFHPMSRGELVRAYPKLFSGTHTSHPAYEHHRVRQVTIAAPGIVPAGTARSRSAGCTVDRPPLRRPMGVRTASTITTSDMGRILRSAGRR